MGLQVSNKFLPEEVRTPVGRPLRFPKIGNNASHPLTLKMREIKDSLGMTTKDLVRALNRFEAEHGRPTVPADQQVSSAFMPFKAVLLSSYLQGWVMQTTYMESVYRRLEAYWIHSRKHMTGDRPTSIKTLMDGWFAQLGIDPKSEMVSPHRELARRITPVLKRAVVIDHPGIFSMGASVNDDLGSYAIQSNGSKYAYLYRKSDPVLIEDGDIVEVGDVVQYSREIVSPKAKYAVSQENPINQSTFFRWYRSDKLPRSRVVIDLIDAAVNEIATA